MGRRRGAVFGERGISEESPDPEINGQSNPFTITGGKPTAPAASQRPAGQPAGPDPPLEGVGSVGEGPALLRGEGRRHSREGARGAVPAGGRKAALMAVGGMLRVAPSPDRSLRVSHRRVGQEVKEGEFQA